MGDRKSQRRHLLSNPYFVSTAYPGWPLNGSTALVWGLETVMSHAPNRRSRLASNTRGAFGDVCV